MATINGVNNSLTSATGTGSFSGSSSPVMTGDIDASGATSFKIPSSAAPSLSVTGQIAVDTTVTGYPGLLNYYSGSEVLIGLGILEADLVNTNTYAVKYNSAGSKLTMGAQATSTTSKLYQYVVATATANDSTSSTSMTNTSLTGSITPSNSSSIILIMCTGYCYIDVNASTDVLYGEYDLRRTTGAASTINSFLIGKNLQDVASSTDYPPYSQMCMCGYETAGSTSIHTYVVRFRVGNASANNNLRGDLSPSTMILMELLP